MAEKIILIPIHGFGYAKEDFYEDIVKRLKNKKYIGSDFDSFVHVEPIYYEDMFHENSKEYLKKVTKLAGGDIIRKFLVNAFGDAAALEHHSTKKNSPYNLIQERIKNQLKSASDECGLDAPIIIVAQSLGCQVISNYIWDAQNPTPSCGIFHHNKRLKNSTSSLGKFQKFSNLKHLITTGCNIPIFLAGFDPKEIKPINISDGNYNFTWENYYDKDDSFGFPLKALSQSYKDSGITDHKINSFGSGFLNFIKSFTVFSHTNYWRDERILRAITKRIKQQKKELNV